LDRSRLQRGDKVVATARSLSSIADLSEKFGDNVLPLALDVTKIDQVKSAIDTAFAHFGEIDIIFNNAGYSLVGTIEEGKADEIRALYETNVLNYSCNSSGFAVFTQTRIRTYCGYF
jgi:NADP-dependent 3-hydroxy acid dehydrogenase YdfG